MKNNIKNLLALWVTLFCASGMSAQQVSIHPGGVTTDSSAILDIIASDKGLLIPRMDSTSRKNIAGPAKGLMVFDSTYNNFWYFDDSDWIQLNSLDQQDLSWSNDSLYLSNDASTVLLEDFKQDLSFINDTLRLINSNTPMAIDLASFRDNLGNHTATQNIQLRNHFLSGDGGSGEGLYVDTLGKVIMNKSDLEFPFPDASFHYEFADPDSSLAINQSVGGAVNQIFRTWQTFTIPYDGFLLHFDIAGNFTGIPQVFTLHEGGPSGPLVASGLDAPPTGLGYTRCSFPYIPVLEGEVYSLNHPGGRTPYFVYFTTLNPYPGGSSGGNPSTDLQFDLYMLRIPYGYQFGDNALVINDYQLPVTDGNTKDILVTDGNSQVNWTNAANTVLADHLGNHTMTQDLQMNGHWINNDGGANEGLYIDTLGNVGVNTVPQANLHVAMGGASNPGFRISDTSILINEYSLPVVDGVANQVLASDGAGVVDWVTPPPPKIAQQLNLSNDTLSLTNGGAPISLAPYLDTDNLGNHTASQYLYLDTFVIQNAINDSTYMSMTFLNDIEVVSTSPRPVWFNSTTPLIGGYIEVTNNVNTLARIGAGGSAFNPGGDPLDVAVGNFSATGDFNLWAGGDKKVQISGAGNVGIGRAATTNILEVNGTASKASAGNWLANSDARLKKNMLALDVQEMLDKLLALQGIRYEWADDQTGMKRPTGIQYGFTAQNIQDVFPSLVSEDQQGYLQTSYGTYDAMKVEAIRALNDKLEKLDRQTAELEQDTEAMAELRSQMQQFRVKK